MQPTTKGEKVQPSYLPKYQETFIWDNDEEDEDENLDKRSVISKRERRTQGKNKCRRCQGPLRKLCGASYCSYCNWDQLTDPSRKKLTT